MTMEMSKDRFERIECLFGKAVGLNAKQLDELFHELGSEERCLMPIVVSLLERDKRFDSKQNEGLPFLDGSQPSMATRPSCKSKSQS